MKSELDDYLVSRFPRIFKNRNGKILETAMCWGFECDDGWFDIIHDLCTRLQQYIDNTSVEQVVATQVKEKYGTLRFYYHGGDDYTDVLVAEAERKSAEVCEVCGDKGKLMSFGGWLKTVCEKHTLK